MVADCPLARESAAHSLDKARHFVQIFTLPSYLFLWGCFVDPVEPQNILRPPCVVSSQRTVPVGRRETFNEVTVETVVTIRGTAKKESR